MNLYKPIQVGEGAWKCGYSFDPLNGTSIRFGTGVDSIESLLDALTLARITYESMIPHGWRATKTDELLDCDDLPYKSGRAYLIDPVARHEPDKLDFTPL